MKTIHGGLMILTGLLSAGTWMPAMAQSSMAMAPRVQASAEMTPRQACLVERQTFPLRAGGLRGSYRSIDFVKEGLVLEMGRNKTATLPYADMTRIDFSPGAFSHADVLIHMKQKHGSYFFEFFLTQASNDKVQTLQKALIVLSEAARQGTPFLCSDDPQEHATALKDFEQKTAAWRALDTKPPVSEDIYKYRLLAEDALKNQNLAGAAKYYEAGVASDPTWAQGWYNVALVYAELKQFGDAADCMKHYVVLQPNAADAQAAKDNVILWEAKAQEAGQLGPGASNTSTLAMGTPTRK
jgi:tetratricopeptide (TPR) repeat protein